MAAGAHTQVDVGLGGSRCSKNTFDMLLQQRPVAVVLAGVHQELLELLRVPGVGSPPPVFGRHLPHACTEPCPELVACTEVPPEHDEGLVEVK